MEARVVLNHEFRSNAVRRKLGIVNEGQVYEQYEEHHDLKGTSISEQYSTLIWIYQSWWREHPDTEPNWYFHN